MIGVWAYDLLSAALGTEGVTNFEDGFVNSVAVDGPHDIQYDDNAHENNSGQEVLHKYL